MGPQYAWAQTGQNEMEIYMHRGRNMANEGWVWWKTWLARSLSQLMQTSSAAEFIFQHWDSSSLALSTIQRAVCTLVGEFHVREYHTALRLLSLVSYVHSTHSETLNGLAHCHIVSASVFGGVVCHLSRYTTTVCCCLLLVLLWTRSTAIWTQTRQEWVTFPATAARSIELWELVEKISWVVDSYQWLFFVWLVVVILINWWLQ